jgi:hypothetical protein
MEADPFRVFLVEMSNALTEKEWRSCANRFPIPKSTRASFEEAFDFFWWLYESQAISPGNLILLKKLFNSTKRIDLVNFIEKFESEFI